MRKCFIIILFLLFNLNNSVAQGCFKSNIIILVDLSGSESGNESKLANAVSSFAYGLKISDVGIKMGVIEFDSYPTVICPLSGDKDSVINNISILYHTKAGGGTYIEDAILEALIYFQNDKRNATNIVIIISDGQIAYSEMGGVLLHKSNFNLNTFAIQITDDGEIDAEGYQKLVNLIQNPMNVSKSSHEELLKALNKLDLCF